MIDLTTVGAVKQRAEVPANNSNDDQEIQDAITAFSRYVIQRTGQSFTNVVAVTETRDGNGNDTMFARSVPIRVDKLNVSPIVVSVCGVSVPQAGAWPSSGWYLSQDNRAFKLRNVVVSPFTRSVFPGGGNYNAALSMYRSGRGFAVGQGNVQLVYPAGYDAVPEDLEYAVRCIVAINYKRKAWQDLESRGITTGGAGSATTRYRDWAYPPEYEEIIQYYVPKALTA